MCRECEGVGRKVASVAFVDIGFVWGIVWQSMGSRCESIYRDFEWPELPRISHGFPSSALISFLLFFLFSLLLRLLFFFFILVIL